MSEHRAYQWGVTHRTYQWGVTVRIHENAVVRIHNEPWRLLWTVLSRCKRYLVDVHTNGIAIYQSIAAEIIRLSIAAEIIRLPPEPVITDELPRAIARFR